MDGGGWGVEGGGWMNSQGKGVVNGRLHNSSFNRKNAYINTWFIYNNIFTSGQHRTGSQFCGEIKVIEPYSKCCCSQHKLVCCGAVQQ